MNRLSSLPRFAEHLRRLPTRLGRAPLIIHIDLGQLRERLPSRSEQFLRIETPRERTRLLHLQLRCLALTGTLNRKSLGELRLNLTELLQINDGLIDVSAINQTHRELRVLKRRLQVSRPALALRNHTERTSYDVAIEKAPVVRSLQFFDGLPVGSRSFFVPLEICERFSHPQAARNDVRTLRMIAHHILEERQRLKRPLRSTVKQHDASQQPTRHRVDNVALVDTVSQRAEARLSLVETPHPV